VVSHDLRSPLNAIVLACEALAEDVPETQRARYVATIRRAVTRADRMLRDLIDLSELESGGRSEQRPIELRALVERAHREHAAAAQERRIALSVEHDTGSDVVVLADRERLAQVLDALIANVIRFAPEHPAMIATRVEDEWGVIEVRDHGPGFVEDALRRFGQPFWQGRRGRRAATGLGLVLARATMIAVGGAITIENVDGGGARVVLRLRRAR